MKALSGPELLARKKRGEQALQSLPCADHPGGAAVLSTFNAASLAPFLAERLEALGAPASVYAAPFGPPEQELLDPESGLHRCRPAFVAVLLAAEDHLRALFQGAPLPPEDAARVIEDRIAGLASALRACAERLPGADFVLVPVTARRPPNPHLLAAGAGDRGDGLERAWLDGLRGLAASHPSVCVAAWDEWEAETGRAVCRTDAHWYTARMRLSLQGLAQLAGLLALHAARRRAPPRKVLVLDFDNTLWGGVAGEDGIAGIEIGDEGRGLAFQDFQRQALVLHSMGVLLAACSKNNEADAFEILDRHPGMLLRRNHFSALRINWADKAENLRGLAEELNLGLDSFVFADDNPVERARVAQALPMVAVLDLPEEPEARPLFLADCGLFSRAGITAEDRLRNDAYQVRREREALRATVQTPADFLASLRQEILIQPVTEATLARAAQLCQKTNQFNLTTRRHGVAELRAMMASPDWELYTASVRDRFEDAGIVGFAAVRQNGEGAEIDSFLLSCRVLGRGVEDALLRFVLARLHARGANRVEGVYLPTAKNAQVADFFPARGFQPAGEGRFVLMAGDQPPEETPEPGVWRPV